MADPNQDTPAPRNRRTGRWVFITVVVIAVLQFGPSLSIIISRQIAGEFNWAGYISYQIGSMVVPLVVGCLGLLFRRNRGLGYFIASILVFVMASIGSAFP